MAFSFETNSRGYLLKRESFDLEYKQSFQFGSSKFEYSRSMVGMANNRGGQIVFGIKDQPRALLGLQNNKFEDFDQASFNQMLLESFSHDFDWELSTRDHNGMTFGIIAIKEANIKPIICRVGNSILREGAIYYRYRGETREIKYTELNNIINNEREKEKQQWMSLIERIGQAGPQNIHLLDTYKGEIQVGKGRIIIDKEILNKIKFIREGRFVEKDGAPALKLIGNIEGIIDSSSMPHLDSLYPHLSTNIQELCDINQYEFQLILRKFNIKGNAKYHFETRTGSRSSTHKYSVAFELFVKDLLKSDFEYMQKLRNEFRRSR